MQTHNARSKKKLSQRLHFQEKKHPPNSAHSSLIAAAAVAQGHKSVQAPIVGRLISNSPGMAERETKIYSRVRCARSTSLRLPARHRGTEAAHEWLQFSTLPGCSTGTETTGGRRAVDRNATRDRKNITHAVWSRARVRKVDDCLFPLCLGLFSCIALFASLLHYGGGGVNLWTDTLVSLADDVLLLLLHYLNTG